MIAFRILLPPPDHALPLQLAMSSASQAPFASDELLPYSADFEMFCEQLVFLTVELSIKLKDAATDALQSAQTKRILATAKEAAVDATSRVRSWMRQTLGRQAVEVSTEELLLPQAVVLPFGLPRVDSIAEDIKDLKTDQQLTHAAVIQLNEHQAELRRLLKRALRTPEQCARCAVAIDAAPSTAGGAISKQDSQICRFGRCRRHICSGSSSQCR